MEWDGGEPTKRPVRIAVYIGQDRPGLLAEITGAISSRHGNIIKAEVTVTEDRQGPEPLRRRGRRSAPAPGDHAGHPRGQDVINVERIRNQ